MMPAEPAPPPLTIVEPTTPPEVAPAAVAVAPAAGTA
ncbi:MAG: M48 family peptidase, partial [Sorangiineae bacterium PRO1]|nr:M48 family peptidase [Sorangiineae bacterium PRO1]